MVMNEHKPISAYTIDLNACASMSISTIGRKATELGKLIGSKALATAHVAPDRDAITYVTMCPWKVK
jgi:hypothetical protein